MSSHKSQSGLDTLTDWLTDRQLYSDFDFDTSVNNLLWTSDGITSSDHKSQVNERPAAMVQSKSASGLCQLH
jgi:hypothetical protein